jgi:hypothetical protein
VETREDVKLLCYSVRDALKLFVNAVHLKLKKAPTLQEFLMRPARILGTLVFLLLCVSAARAQSERLTVTGKLTRALAVGAETSGWAIQLESERTIDGKRVSSIEVQSTNPKQLETLENQNVKASGTLSHVEGVETGPRTVLTIKSIKAIKAKSDKEPDAGR